jgi:hypothetical protein
MLSEFLQAKRFLGAKFGYGEPIRDGVYAVPTMTSKGKAFFRLEMQNQSPTGTENFRLFWDEKLTISWYEKPKPYFKKESKWSSAFRELESLRD